MTRTEFNLLKKFVGLVLRFSVAAWSPSLRLSREVLDFRHDLDEYGKNEVPSDDEFREYLKERALHG